MMLGRVISTSHFESQFVLFTEPAGVPFYFRTLTFIMLWLIWQSSHQCLSSILEFSGFQGVPCLL